MIKMIEIVIMSEMIEAGVYEFLGCRSLMTETPEDAVKDIFTVMMSVAPKPKRHLS